MTTVVISQPMYLPWVGLFEQIALADVFFHYDDAQFPQGRSFTSRVQIKTAQGTQWLTVPVRRSGKQHIKDIRFSEDEPWRRKHIAQLQHAYARAPHAAEMLALASEIYALETDSLSELNIAATERIAAYLGLQCRFLKTSDAGVSGVSTEKLLGLVQSVEGTRYVTGHGARNYLDHELFEAAGVRVEYMDYRRRPYPQLHGAFDPHVSILDLIANVGTAAREYVGSPAMYWKEFLA